MLGYFDRGLGGMDADSSLHGRIHGVLWQNTPASDG
jgi:hypothetical protein